MSEKQNQNTKLFLTMTSEGVKAKKNPSIPLGEAFAKISGGKVHKSLNDALEHVKTDLKRRVK